MSRWNEILNEPVSREHRDQVLAMAKTEMAPVANRWWRRAFLLAPVAAGMVLWLSPRNPARRDEDADEANFAAMIDVKTLTEIGDIEELADLELIEDLEVLEQWENS